MSYIDRIDDFIDSKGQFGIGNGLSVTNLVAQLPLAEDPNITMEKLKERMLDLFSPEKQELIYKFLEYVDTYHGSHRVLPNGEYGYEDAYWYHWNTTVPYMVSAIRLLGQPNPRCFNNLAYGGMAMKFVDDALDCMDDNGMNMFLGLANDNGELEIFQQGKQQARRRKIMHQAKLTRQQYVRCERI